MARVCTRYYGSSVESSVVYTRYHESPPLKELDRNLADFLEADYLANISEPKRLLHEELLCCCERARHAIKDFTNRGDDSEVADCFPVAGDALGDLHWCLGKICCLSDLGEDVRTWAFNILDLVLFPLMSELRLRRENKLGLRIKNKLGLRIKNKLASLRIKLQGTSERSCSSDARNGAHLPPGRNVDEIGEIQHLSALGEGSQGMVYKARWSSRPLWGEGGEELAIVAVKEVFSDTRSEGLEALGRSSGCDSVSSSSLYSELDVLHTLNHPNIVELKGYTRKAKAGKYGLVMELMTCSLRHLIAVETLSDLVKVDTLLQVARGMHFLHTVGGIMHRDLKPANILIRELNYLPDPNARRLRYVVAKLADFGLSKVLPKQEGLAVDGAGWHTYKQGTHFYMAPELRRKNSWYSKSADVFSFGTTCFNVLTGEEDPCKFSEFYERIKRRDLDQLLQKCGESQMTLLVRQCWSLDPNSRPPFAKICQILEDEKRWILVEDADAVEHLNS